jgi:hypothetical protein
VTPTYFSDDDGTEAEGQGSTPGRGPEGHGDGRASSVEGEDRETRSSPGDVVETGGGLETAAAPSSDRSAIEAEARRAGVRWDSTSCGNRGAWVYPDGREAAWQFETAPGRWMADGLHASEIDALRALPPTECTRVDPCLTRRDLDITVAGEVGVVSILFDDHGQVWALHDDAGRMVVAIDHCPWCGLSLGGGL